MVLLWMTEWLFIWGKKAMKMFLTLTFWIVGIPSYLFSSNFIVTFQRYIDSKVWYCGLETLGFFIIFDISLHNVYNFYLNVI